MVVEESLHVIFDESNNSLQERVSFDDDLGLETSMGNWKLKIEDNKKKLERIPRKKNHHFDGETDSHGISNDDAHDIVLREHDPRTPLWPFPYLSFQGCRGRFEHFEGPSIMIHMMSSFWGGWILRRPSMAPVLGEQSDHQHKPRNRDRCILE